MHRYKTPGDADVVFPVPLHLQAILPSQLTLNVPEIECRRTGLEAPCWIILDEYNRVEMDKDYDFVSTEPIGTITAGFLREIATAMKRAARSSSIRAVKRT